MTTERKGKGQAAAELALLLPLLLLIVLGCLDLGRVFSAWLILSNGAREGARYGASFPVTTIVGHSNDIVERTRVDILREGMAIRAEDVSVSFPVMVDGLPVGGSPVVVSATYRLPMTTLFLFGGQPVTIRATTQMAILEGGSG